MITFSTYDSTINSYYLAFYGRPADPSGLKFWSQALVANNGDTSAIIQAFATSDEAQVRFGSDTLAARVTEIYQQLFNRAPDAAGLAYWTDAVEQGKASLADVAVAILKGAQSSDLDLSTMRQKAADAFTTAVENGSTEYSGYASIEAARVLVRAVTVDANDADLAKLVKAAVSFADTATKNPKVVDAIATGSTLLNLYDSARGLKDPVALTQALADTAKAAAGDPVTLESLLRGGGMDKVLKVMPAKATLLDVVEALAKGGLPAAVEVVYPSAPSVKPPPAPAALKLDFASVSQGDLDSNKHDKLTNVEDAAVTFKYSGNIAGQTFDYSTDGGQHWQTKYLTVDIANKLVLIDDVFLGQIQQQQRMSVQGVVSEPQHVITNFQLRATDASGKTTVGTADLEFDGYAMTPVLTFDTSKSIDALYHGGIITNNTEFGVQAEVDAKVEYKLVPMEFGRGLPDVSGNDGWSTALAMVEGYQTILVRQTDAAGNRSEEKEFSFVLDTKASNLVPTIALATDSGTPGDGVTSDGTVNIGNLERGVNSGWQYSIDGGKWILGGASNYQGSTTFDLGTLDVTSGVLRVRQVDAAGNVGAMSAGMAFVLENDPAVPEPTPTSTTSAASFSLSGSPGSLVLTSTPYAIKATTIEGQAGLLDRSQLYLSSVVEGGRNVATDKNYMDGENFAVLDGGFLRFDAQLTTGLYRLNWTDGAFATTSGHLPQGNVLFAGGIKGYVLDEGFAIDSLITLTGSNDYSDTSGSHAYSYMDFGVSWSIFTGKGHDVIVDDGSNLDIGYRSFNRDAQDLIFKFDAGNDKISLHEKAGLAIDDNNDGIITWASSAQVHVKAVVTAATEAVQIVLGAYISTGTGNWSTTTTLQTLNDALDLSGMRQEGDLLILAKNAVGNGGALFHFIDTNGNQVIEKDELNIFAVFDSGAPVQSDIIVVGTQMPD